MIRQTITCDACGIERKEVNHWFEAYEHEGELRIRGLNPTKTSRAGLRHLCGQTCLHRLVDDFLAGNLGSRMFGGHEDAKSPMDFARLAAESDRATEGFDLGGFESSARLIEVPGLKPKPVSPSRSASPQQPLKEARKRRAAASDALKVSNVGSFAPAAASPSLPSTPAVAISPGFVGAVAGEPSGAFARPGGPSEAKTAPALMPGFAAAARRPQPVSASNRVEAATASTYAFEEPTPQLTAQMRRSLAWERERAREKESNQGAFKDRKRLELR